MKSALSFFFFFRRLRLALCPVGSGTRASRRVREVYPPVPYIEATARKEGHKLEELTLAELDRLWREKRCFTFPEITQQYGIFNKLGSA